MADPRGMGAQEGQAAAELTFSSRAFTSHSCRCFRLLYGLFSKPSKLGSAAPEEGGDGTWG